MEALELSKQEHQSLVVSDTCVLVYLPHGVKFCFTEE